MNAATPRSSSVERRNETEWNGMERGRITREEKGRHLPIHSMGGGGGDLGGKMNIILDFKSCIIYVWVFAKWLFNFYFPKKTIYKVVGLSRVEVTTCRLCIYNYSKNNENIHTDYKFTST